MLCPASSTSLVSLYLNSLSPSKLGFQTSIKPSNSRRQLGVLDSASASNSAFQAPIFNCNGIILESEHLYFQAYDDAFVNFNVRCESEPEPLNWGIEFYDELQNQIGGKKPKMRWYFKEHGWPSLMIFENPPENDEDRAKLIDTIQDWKTERYIEIIKFETVEPRPRVLRLMDVAKAAVR